MVALEFSINSLLLILFRASSVIFASRLRRSVFSSLICSATTLADSIESAISNSTEFLALSSRPAALILGPTRNTRSVMVSSFVKEQPALAPCLRLTIPLYFSIASMPDED